MSARSPFVSAVLALGVLVLGCGPDEPRPVTVAKAFAAAVQSGDVERVLELTQGSAMAHLRQVAGRASDQVGGRRNIEPHEMLQVVDVDPSFQIAKAELVGGDGSTSAVVALTGADGTVHELSLVLEDDQWRVSVPVPADPVEES